MSTKLTGRTRHRVHKPFLRSPLMILQVEEVTSWDDFKTRSHNWRDAKAEDFQISNPMPAPMEISRCLPTE